MRVTQISESINLISFNNTDYCGRCVRCFVDNFPQNPPKHDDLLDDQSVSRTKWLLCEIYGSTRSTEKSTEWNNVQNRKSNPVLFAQARLHWDNKPRQIGLNHDYNMTVSI